MNEQEINLLISDLTRAHYSEEDTHTLQELFRKAVDAGMSGQKAQWKKPKANSPSGDGLYLVQLANGEIRSWLGRTIRENFVNPPIDLNQQVLLFLDYNDPPPSQYSKEFDAFEKWGAGKYLRNSPEYKWALRAWMSRAGVLMAFLLLLCLTAQAQVTVSQIRTASYSYGVVAKDSNGKVFSWRYDNAYQSSFWYEGEEPVTIVGLPEVRWVSYSYTRVWPTGSSTCWENAVLECEITPPPRQPHAWDERSQFNKFYETPQTEQIFRMVELQELNVNTAQVPIVTVSERTRVDRDDGSMILPATWRFAVPNGTVVTHASVGALY